MQTVPIELDRSKARALYREYKKHAHWSAPPGDPLLLRRIGHGDLWLVVVQWDLTAVEKAALATRVRA